MEACVICLDNILPEISMTSDCCDYIIHKECFKMAVGDTFKCSFCHSPIDKKVYLKLFGKKSHPLFLKHAIDKMMEIPLFDNDDLKMYIHMHRKIRPKMNDLENQIKDIENQLPHGQHTIQLYKNSPMSISIMDIQHIKDHTRIKKRLLKLQGDNDINKMMNKRVIPTAKCTQCPEGLVIRMTCHLCGQTYCKECHALSHNGPCDPHVLSTYRYQLANCNRCPKCFTFYQKVEGCDDMYCTHCHTFFSNRLGHIYRYARHNPDYAQIGQRTVTDVLNDEPIIRGRYRHLLPIHRFYMRVYQILLKDDEFDRNAFKAKKKMQLSYLNDPNDKAIHKDILTWYDLDRQRHIAVQKCGNVLVEYRKQLTLLYNDAPHQIELQYEKDLMYMKRLKKTCLKRLQYFTF